ncbi:Multifunctional pyrimidine synthesis protein CAD, partial [Coemansia sp. RSA 2531]
MSLLAALTSNPAPVKRAASMVAGVMARSLASATEKPPLAAHYPVTPGSLTAHLQLRSGETFTGGSFGALVSTVGETVFTTSLVGYPESMTDP